MRHKNNLLFLQVGLTNRNETPPTKSSKDLPSTSTSDQLQNNNQNQVYTLGLSNGLKHLSKTENIPAGNPGQKSSNLSVFRIYPLSRSEEKGTQTLSKETTVCHKSVQCEIWSTNPTTYIHLQGNTSEDVGCCENTITNVHINTVPDKDKNTVEDGKENEDTETLTGPEKNAETRIDLSDIGSFEIQGNKKSTGYFAAKNQTNADVLDVKNDIALPTSQDKDKETFTKQSILTDDIRSLGRQNIERATLKEGVTSLANQDQNTEIVSKENTLRGTMASLIGQKKNTESYQSQNSVETCESNVEVETSKNQVSTQPPFNVSTSCLDNTIAQNDTALQKIGNDPMRKASEQVIRTVGYSVENVIPNTLLLLAENTEKGITTPERKVKAVSPTEKSTMITIGQTDKTAKVCDKPDQTSITDKTTESFSTPSHDSIADKNSNSKTYKSTALPGERHEITIPKDKTNEITMPCGETDKTTKHDGETDIVQQTRHHS